MTIIKQIDPYLVDAKPVLCEECEKITSTSLEDICKKGYAEWVIIEEEKATFLCPYHALISIYSASIKAEAKKQVGG